MIMADVERQVLPPSVEKTGQSVMLLDAFVETLAVAPKDDARFLEVSDEQVGQFVPVGGLQREIFKRGRAGQGNVGFAGFRIEQQLGVLDEIEGVAMPIFFNR